VRALAAFAASDFGRYYAGLCRYWGVDPAAFLQEEDDLMALNLRAALTRTLASESEPEPEPQMLRLASRFDG
jgi:hypothetical protein